MAEQLESGNEGIVKRRQAILAGLLVLLGSTSLWAASTSLAAEGKPCLRIVIAGSASPRVAAAAGTLADYLGRIAGAPFEVVRGDGREGIAVGLDSDFKSLKLESQLDAPIPARNEQYLLRSHAAGVWVVGATELAVEHAVWDLLHRLGYRQFFPGAHWEIVPNTPDLRLAVDANERPDYYSRKIWYGFHDWSDMMPAKRAWDARNRMGGSIDLQSGHAYAGIISANQSEFDRHPEYLCSAKSSKLRISNPGLRKLVVDDALDYFDKNPDRDFISMEPSDGGGWECPGEEQVFSNISDRVVTLANAVAEALQQRYTNKYVGIYAYFQHSPPPTLRVHSNVVVSVATAFIQGPYTVEQLLSGWRRQGAVLGVRDYFSITVKHKDLPGRAKAGDPGAIRDSIRRYHELGARFMSAESGNGWGPLGLGHYVAARLLWNTGENFDAIVDDFFQKAFGPAEAPMRVFYRLIDRSSKPLLSQHLVGSLYRQLEAARRLTRDPGIRSRLDDLTLYTRYVELLRTIKDEGAEAVSEPSPDDVLALLKDDNGSILKEPVYKADGTERVLSFAYRIRGTHMVHSLALWRDTRGFGFRSPVSIESWSVPEGKNPWKSSKPFTPEEVESFIREGIAANPVAGFTPVSFSEDLVPAASRLRLKSRIAGYQGPMCWRFAYYVWLEEPGTLRIAVSGGQFKGRGDPFAKMSLYAEDDPTELVAATAQAPLDKASHTVELTSAFKGLHRLEVTDGGWGFEIAWPPGARVSILSSYESQTSLRGVGAGSKSRGWTLYFYVPRGTPVVGGFGEMKGKVRDGDGRMAYEFSATNKAGYFSIPVPPGQDGKLWSFEESRGRRLLMTVPPYLAQTAEDLLLPKEVVEADEARVKQ